MRFSLRRLLVLLAAAPLVLIAGLYLDAWRVKWTIRRAWRVRPADTERLFTARFLAQPGVRESLRGEPAPDEEVAALVLTAEVDPAQPLVRYVSREVSIGHFRYRLCWEGLGWKIDDVTAG